jgi:DNA-binding transcriptional MocR family regulator
MEASVAGYCLVTIEIRCPPLFEWLLYFSRMTEPILFDEAPPPGTINFGIGQPSADLLPVDLVGQASESFFRDAQPLELNYGSRQGDPRFLDSLAAFLTASYGAEVSPDCLFVTGGNSQAIDMVSNVFANPGDTVFVEEPSYFLAFKIFRDHGLNIVSLPMDQDGVNIPALEKALQNVTPAFIYTIPSYHNPTGICASEERRTRLVELAQAHAFKIVADEPYQLLYYKEAPPPALGTMAASEVVVSLGSFSKILAPGMRLGWVHTSPALREKVMASGFVRSGGSINQISSHIARHAIDNGLLEKHVDKLRNVYRSRAEIMDDALHAHFDGLAEWTRPNGGYFFWLRMDKSVHTASFRDKARELETGFQPGSSFSSTGNLENYLRLSFAHYDEADIREGISRLRRIFNDDIGN